MKGLADKEPEEVNDFVNEIFGDFNSTVLEYSNKLKKLLLT